MEEAKKDFTSKLDLFFKNDEEKNEIIKAVPTFLAINPESRIDVVHYNKFLKNS